MGLISRVSSRTYRYSTKKMSQKLFQSHRFDPNANKNLLTKKRKIENLQDKIKRRRDENVKKIASSSSESSSSGSSSSSSSSSDSDSEPEIEVKPKTNVKTQQTSQKLIEQLILPEKG